jgi:hypothetical protein
MISTLNTHIRNLFPHPTYSVADAAALLGIDGGEVRGWIESGEVEAVGTEGEARLPWSEVVMLGMEVVWTQPEVEEALGEDLGRAMPALVRLADLHVRVPRFEVAGLEALASRDGMTVDALLESELLDLVSAQSEWLRAAVPRFGEALEWPASDR